MKLLPTLVLALTAAASGMAGAATHRSDQDRRDENREQALSKWRADHGELASSSSTSNGMQRSSLREKTREGASSVRNFTHRQAEKARRFSERQDRRLGKEHAPVNTSPEGGGK